MKRWTAVLRTLALAGVVPVLAACGGGHLSVENPEGRGTYGLEFPPGQAVEHRLPEGSGGLPPYVYDVVDIGEGNCPPWVTFFPDRRILAGTAPAAASGQTFLCTYEVSETDPRFREQRQVLHGLRLQVGPLEVADLMLAQPDNVSLSVGDLYNEPFPPATGGVQPYTYAFECAGGSPPLGMNFAPATRRLAGTPDAPFHDSCTYSATDSSVLATTVSRAVEVEVTGPVTGTLMLPRPGKVDLSVGTFRDVEFSPASGGVEPYMYTFACAGGSPPLGMNFAPETRRFAGTPRERFRDSCTYSVTDSAAVASTVSRAVEVVVAGPVTGTLMLGDPPGVDLSVGTFRDVLFPAASGGVEPYMYTFACAGGSPPLGMNFAPETRRFAGTPRERFRDSCTYSVTDSAAVASTVSRAVEVVVAGPVTGTLTLPASVVPGNVIRLRVNERARVTFREATGGVEPYTYDLQCPNLPPTGPSNPVSTLPLGLGFGPLTRVLSGTPGAAYRGPDCTYRVTDSATPSATLARSVALIIEPGRAKWRFTTRSLLQEDQSMPIRLSHTPTKCRVRVSSMDREPWTFSTAPTCNSLSPSPSSSGSFPTTPPAPPTWKELAGAMDSPARAAASWASLSASPRGRAC